MKKKNKVLKIKSPKGMPIPKPNEVSIQHSVDNFKNKKFGDSLDKINLKAIEAGHRKFIRERSYLW